MNPKIGVVFSGCGVLDGSEISEAVLTLFFLTRRGADPVCMAPNIPQREVIDHLTGKVTGETRNVLVESARIARGKIHDLAEVDAAQLDGLIFPGGFGAAKNLCDFAEKGADAQVDPGVSALIREVHKARKPIGFLCISPAVAASVLGSEGVELTIGRDLETAVALEKMGATHVVRGVEDIHVDTRCRVVSTPAYMYEAPLPEIGAGIERLVRQVLALIE